jgi:hypothetical protein
MINNSTNINKTRNHLSHLLKNTHDMENPGPDLGQAQKCGGIKPVIDFPSLPS